MTTVAAMVLIVATVVLVVPHLLCDSSERCELCSGHVVLR